MKRSGFTMIELIFVIVILGILAAVAIPKLAATRDDAELAARATQVQTAINEIGAYVTARNTYDANMTKMSVAAGAMVASGQAASKPSNIVVFDTRPKATGAETRGCVAIVETTSAWTGVAATDDTTLTTAVSAVTLSVAGVVGGNDAWTATKFGNQNLSKLLVTVHSSNTAGGCDVIQKKIPAGFTIVKGRSAQF